ncbi:glutathione S-transferase [Rhodanobacter sp. K2T2]|uniref:glutathione S-transferase n=1 Tax=Rhodanobacter sp. K2T2 TaxID=2723085 RepID=UPI0015C7CE6F|nr:glutathione S-transferase family protein [Rhodanobacter sp. K2T2]NYE29118.1 glutathione S-transferase [Rhodanobacter sp. K2T2]
MKLIGMLDSPYVRRVAISLQMLGIPFEHQSLSVFGGFDEFQRINPLVKAPTLICDDGDVLIDSTLILQYAEAIASTGRSLMPTDAASLRHSLRLIGLALAACEKSVQIVYERKLRPTEKQYAPWVERVTGQLLAAYDALEAASRDRSLAVTSGTIDQAGITTAVAWKFTQEMLPDIVQAADYPPLRMFSDKAEALAAFAAAPCGPSTYRAVA